MKLSKLTPFGMFRKVLRYRFVFYGQQRFAITLGHLCAASINRYKYFSHLQIDSLTWDPQHRVNGEQRYCYCGDDGDWLREMIQCSRCQQWFHGRCIRSLQYPIFLGDRFYFFICSICNHGHEFVRRLDLSWPDLIHLVLYNLIARNGKRFYDVTKAIVLYVEDNWKTLQMSDQVGSFALALISPYNVRCCVDIFRCRSCRRMRERRSLPKP